MQFVWLYVLLDRIWLSYLKDVIVFLTLCFMSDVIFKQKINKAKTY